MDVQKGDILLVKLTGGRSSRPVNPDGQIYSDRHIPLYGGSSPVYQYRDEGEIVCVKMMKAGGTLKGKWKKTSESHKKIFDKWCKTQAYRRGDFSPGNHLDSVPEDPDYPAEYKEEQEERESKETEDKNAWDNKKSDMMSDLDNL